MALTSANLPAHSHSVCVDSNPGTTPLPTNNIPAQTARPQNAAAGAPAAPLLYTAPPNTPLHTSMVGPTGGGQAHENRQPFLAINYCICTMGYYPARN